MWLKNKSLENDLKLRYQMANTTELSIAVTLSK